MQSHKSVLYILITAFCFGTMEVALKIGGASFAPLQMNFLRFLIGGLILLPLTLKDMARRKLTLTKGDWAYLTMLGLVGVCLSMSCFQIGVMNLNANTASVMISSNPVFTMLFAYFLFGEPFTKRKALVLVHWPARDALTAAWTIAGPEFLLTVLCFPAAALLPGLFRSRRVRPRY